MRLLKITVPKNHSVILLNESGIDLHERPKGDSWITLKYIDSHRDEFGLSSPHECRIDLSREVTSFIPKIQE